MKKGDIITTNKGVDMRIREVKKHILICTVLDWEDNSTSTRPDTPTRIVRKENVSFVQGQLL